MGWLGWGIPQNQREKHDRGHGESPEEEEGLADVLGLEQPCGQWRDVNRRKSDPRHDDARDQAFAFRLKPFDRAGCHRGIPESETHATENPE
ncbi:MAG: hypothetical protein BWY82_01482 [Verrucomicrobia bacterium ADurb.Bin474]|nr:MAG: hypothetical protein BWY82_01482 [Verrucomicrobia bacterium ADurb.Bin474]